MATWQQGLNSGGLLAGIGQNNSNAPQASDINSTLSIIRANQEADRSGQNNVGLQALQGIQSVQQQYQQAQQQQKTQEFQQAFGQAYAKGDREALKQLAANNPEQIEAIQKGMGFIDADKNQQIGSASMDLQLAAQTGNPQSVASAIQKNAGVLQGLGLDPETAFQAYQQDPQNFSRTADLIGMHALGPDKYFDFQDKAAGRDIQRNTLAETMRSNQAGEALTSRGQDITMRGQNISAQNAAFDREIKRAELQDKTLDRQIARETNQVKLQGLLQKQEQARNTASQAKLDKQATAQGAVDTFSTALNSLDTITNSPGLSKAVGIRSALPTIPGSDAANFEAQLDTFKAQTFLPMVASLKGMGALSDAEGKKLSDAVGALSPKMSETAFRKSADQIKSSLEQKLGTVKTQFNYQDPPQQAAASTTSQQQPAQGGYSSLWGD